MNCLTKNPKDSTKLKYEENTKSFQMHNAQQASTNAVILRGHPDCSRGLLG